jgi:glucoamylase
MNAPGSPGIQPRWTSSSKDGVGTSISSMSRIWFTISHGIINEIYYPRIDIANTRDFQFLVANGKDYFSEERRDTTHTVEMVEDGVPAYHLINESKDGSYRIEKTIITDPNSDVLLQNTRFSAVGKKKFDLYALFAPHILNGGFGNTGWIGEYKGRKMFFATKRGITVAVYVSTAFENMSCGFVGVNDGWQDISRNHKMTFQFDRAENGNIAFTGLIKMVPDQWFTIAIGFGANEFEAGEKVTNSIVHGFQKTYDQYVSEWKEYIESHFSDFPSEIGKLSKTSAAVIKSHQAKFQFQGAIIASLSIPWGNQKGDDDIGGYHLVWPRDMVEAAEALVAIGDYSGAVAALDYLRATQEADGHWCQNMWLDGKGFWKGIQMDETAFPVLLAGMLKKYNVIKAEDYYEMVLKAASFIIKYGPVTMEDRWEEDSGYSPFTISCEIAALLTAAEFSDLIGNRKIANFMRDNADMYYSRIDFWNYARDTDISKELGIDGYYVRIAPQDSSFNFASSPLQGYVPVKNRPTSDAYVPAEKLVSTGSTSLVRFGLRKADDYRIINSLRVVDSLLKTSTKTGPVWHRYNNDGYGEHSDGSPFDGTGHGRGWPLLTGERAHYELAAGRISEAMNLLKTIENQTSPGGMIPEQVWDSDDIPRLGLYNGKPSGSAMPLVWAHAEYLKLVKSIDQKTIFDMPDVTRKRYLEKSTITDKVLWSFFNRERILENGKTLRIQVIESSVVHWSDDKWKTVHDDTTIDSEIGVHYVDIKPSDESTEIRFTFFWKTQNRWEGKDFSVSVIPASNS